MTGINNPYTALRVHLTNVQGEGAVQLVTSLLPALERNAAMPVGRIDLPVHGPLADYQRQAAGQTPVILRRRLPNSLSRLVECLSPLTDDDDAAPLLVLGDLPQRTKARQTVFVHTTNLLARQQGMSRGQLVKFAVMRAVFARNLRHANALIVQSDMMRELLVARYPAAAGRVHVVQQPPPEWLLKHSSPPPRSRGEPLRLFYPAAGYPHKNHELVLAIVRLPEAAASIEHITITVPTAPNAPSSLLNRVGRLDPKAMRQAYDQADALFFPSFSESYGLPLIEAMWLGLPIICADLPYARTLCRDGAIYFDPADPLSALHAITTMRERLAAGWRPDWQACLADIPRSWDIVAQRMALIARG